MQVPGRAMNSMPAPSFGRAARVQFTGRRGELFMTLVTGYLLMIPTIGVYRFWLTTAKRRFFWSHTEIDGDPLEYTGNALQLLVGFLFAVGVFLPIYLLFVYLSTQSQQVALIGYGAVAVLVWFLMGFAIYKARDFRLSRTLWRGIRFDQTGSAWAYAARRFGWSVLMLFSLGLAYPFMAGDLWRYRYDNTWFGDRRFSFHGSWKTIARPFYLVYFAIAGFIAALAGLAFYRSDYAVVDGVPVPGPLIISLAFVPVLMLWIGVYYVQARETSLMLSSVRIGETRLHVQLLARTLISQLLIYSFALSGIIFAGFILGALVFAVGLGVALGAGWDSFDWTILTRSSVLPVALAIGGYLTLVSIYSLIGEMILGFGYWQAVAQATTVSNLDALGSVRSRGEDQALAGEGLADALNVGAY